MNCFSWIKPIPVLIHVKYWYYDSPYLELPCLFHHLYQFFSQPTVTCLQHNPHNALHRFPYFALPHSITHHYKYWIYQTTSQAKTVKLIIKLYTDHDIWWVERYYASKSLVFNESCFPFKVKQHGQQQLYAQYKISWIPYKMVGASLFPQPYLCIQPLL